MTPVERFLTGQTNLLLDVPFDRRADVRAARDVQIAEMPGGSWDMLLFNLADPTRPRDAYDEDGARRDQGQHPLFGDLRVRRAVQLAINVDEVIESAFHGNATRIAANYPPTSWAFDPDLAPLGYDPTEAERLLDEAGWVDVDGDGVRNCYHCLYGTEGMDFYFLIGLDPQQAWRAAMRRLNRSAANCGASALRLRSQNRPAPACRNLTPTGSRLGQKPRSTVIRIRRRCGRRRRMWWTRGTIPGHIPIRASTRCSNKRGCSPVVTSSSGRRCTAKSPRSCRPISPRWAVCAA
ncbi:MAG: hypothetical protein IPK17_20530 [Chloroflexi bacterium]|uniref:ABC transporter substrate-binding protein n=1 Tax=Candidatus Flexifilum breve TaxID=3140694 RepID=UPI0031355960|nr:hypothetical protein [Chloroflexota bacterium]